MSEHDDQRQIPRVALLIETSRGFGRSLMRGIVRYASLHGPWEFYITPSDYEQTLPDMNTWSGTGIIARIETTKLAKKIVNSGLPFIGLDISQNVEIDAIAGEDIHEIASDSRLAARMAAEHLMSRNLKHFAFVGESGRRWSAIRQSAFEECLREAGFQDAIYSPQTARHKCDWAHELPHMVEWLQRLPKPVGIMASNDDRGRQVLEACSSAKLRVGFEVLVIGVDNDELLCELSRPQLSSVALKAEESGYRAAAVLDKLMRGQVLEPQRLLVEPTHVVERGSTAPYATIEDDDVIAALDFLQTHAAEEITIEQLVSQFSISRRSFELRFKKSVGATPHQVLRQLRLDRAKRLLTETDQSVEEIALASGYSTLTNMSKAFNKELGLTPTQYRGSNRG